MPDNLNTNVLLLYALPMLFIWAVFIVRKRFVHRISIAKQRESIVSGLTEPASLHPVIDPSKCLACGACVKACPEGEILGLIDGKAKLITPANCIGHGACSAACPFDAISLVFGTATRGVDIPMLQSNFETNVPGIFIAGELGGMGLIRNAIEQGAQAAEEIHKKICSTNRSAHTSDLDLVIVGAGPAGIAASLSAKNKGLRFITIDQDSLGGTVSHFPRNKLVLTAPVNLPLVGKVEFRETTKEALLEFWQSIIQKTQLTIHFNERLENIQTQNEQFKVYTTQDEYTSSAVLLCLGRRGTPRQLNVPGEELPKVVYRLIDAEQYSGKKVLVVGGGDSAIEAAVSISEKPGTSVYLSYRGSAFSRVKPKNREKLEAAEYGQKLKVLLNSQISEIDKNHVSIEHKGKIIKLENDAVIICVGGVLPTPFLEQIGIKIETKYGTA